MDYFVDMTTHVPQGTPQETVVDIRAREAARAPELSSEGHLKRLWRPPLEPGQWLTLGLWSADDATGLTATLESLPLYVWMTVEATPLALHPSDPLRGAGS